MFVITTKVSKTRLAAAVTLVLAAVVLVAVLAAARRGGEETESRNGASNEARVSFLTGYGWELNPEPVQTQSIKLPTEETEVFRRYNALQKSQGFDLSQYAGQQATRYVYEILNYPEADSPVYATVFVLKGEIIGGDVTNTAPDGKLHGFQKPE